MMFVLPYTPFLANEPDFAGQPKKEPARVTRAGHLPPSKISKRRVLPERRRMSKKQACVMSKLNGKIAIITGGSSGIRLAAAKKFAAQSAHALILGRRPSHSHTAKTTTAN